jgi:hypothetical protein
MMVLRIPDPIAPSSRLDTPAFCREEGAIDVPPGPVRYPVDPQGIAIA